VQAGATAAGGVNHRSYERGAVGAEHGLRGLHLDLEPQAAGRQRVRRLQVFTHHDHGLDLVDRGHLGQGHDEAERQRSRTGELPDEQVEGTYAAPSGLPLEALEPDADVRGRSARVESLPQHLRRGRGSGVLLGIGA